MDKLYCIKHGTMRLAHPIFETIRFNHEDGTPDERAIQSGVFHYHQEWVGVGVGYYTEPCDFDDGWATCPPPEFDLDAWVESLGYEYELESEEEAPASLEDMDFYNEFLLPRLRSQDGQ